CFSHTAQHRFGNRLRCTGQRDDGAVVVCIALRIDHRRATNLTHGLDQRRDAAGIAAFRKIRDALDERSHVEPAGTAVSARTAPRRCRETTPGASLVNAGLSKTTSGTTPRPASSGTTRAGSPIKPTEAGSRRLTAFLRMRKASSRLLTIISQ